jgi:heme oxygenase
MTATTVLRPRPRPEAQAEQSSERVLNLLRYEARPYTILLHRHERIAGIATRADYVATLELLLGFHRPLDRWIAATLRPLAAELQLTRRAKAPLLSRDLAALNAVPGALRFQPLPLRGAIPYALGWLYGVELVGLGGRLVARRLGQALGVRADAGAAYFTGYGADASEAWRALTRTISRRVNSESDRMAALDGMTDFFEALSDWLSLP